MITDKICWNLKMVSLKLNLKELEIIDCNSKSKYLLDGKILFFCVLKFLFPNKSSTKMKDDLQQYSVWKFDLR